MQADISFERNAVKRILGKMETAMLQARDTVAQHSGRISAIKGQKQIVTLDIFLSLVEIVQATARVEEIFQAQHNLILGLGRLDETTPVSVQNLSDDFNRLMDAYDNFMELDYEFRSIVADRNKLLTEIETRLATNSVLVE